MRKSRARCATPKRCCSSTTTRPSLGISPVLDQGVRAHERAGPPRRRRARRGAPARPPRRRPVRSPRRTPAFSSHEAGLAACCSARISVGATGAPCTPFFAARRKASRPRQSSRCRRPLEQRAIARPEDRSAEISRSAPSGLPSDGTERFPRRLAHQPRRPRGRSRRRSQQTGPLRSIAAASTRSSSRARIRRDSSASCSLAGCTPSRARRSRRASGRALGFQESRSSAARASTRQALGAMPRRGDRPDDLPEWRIGLSPDRRTPFQDSPAAALRPASRQESRRGQAPCPTAPPARTRDNGCARRRGPPRYRRRRPPRCAGSPAASGPIGLRASGRTAWPLVPRRPWPRCRSAGGPRSGRGARAGSLRRFECPPARAGRPAPAPGVESARPDREATAPPGPIPMGRRKTLYCGQRPGVINGPSGEGSRGFSRSERAETPCAARGPRGAGAGPSRRETASRQNGEEAAGRHSEDSGVPPRRTEPITASQSIEYRHSTGSTSSQAVPSSIRVLQKRIAPSPRSPGVRKKTGEEQAPPTRTPRKLPGVACLPVRSRGAAVAAQHRLPIGITVSTARPTALHARERHEPRVSLDQQKGRRHPGRRGSWFARISSTSRPPDL